MMEFDPGSFKDPCGRVFRKEGRVFRRLTPEGEKTWSALTSAGFLPELEDRGYLVKTWEAPAGEFLETIDGPATLLEHEAIPFLSYPYEWPFALLKRAALLHLEILERILPRGFILKDATPFNVQFTGLTPRFIDLLSFDRYKEGDVWSGYGQFCDTMLYPLLLQASKGIPFQAWLRGTLQGLDPVEFSKLFGMRDLFRGGILVHVKLRAKLHERFQDPTRVTRREIQGAKLPLSAILRNIGSLKQLVKSLEPKRSRQSHWLDYAEKNSYTEESRALKAKWISAELERLRPKRALDLGCNTGEFSRLASSFSEHVISVDNDEEVIDHFAAHGEPKNILPLVLDLANPTPALGWDCRERPSFFERCQFDVVLALALVHHLAIRNNIPLERQLDLFRSLGRHSLIEFVDRKDPMTQRLMTNTGTDHAEYNREAFHAHLTARGKVLASLKLSPTREIFSVQWNRDYSAISPTAAPGRDENLTLSRPDRATVKAAAGER